MQANKPRGVRPGMIYLPCLAVAATASAAGAVPADLALCFDPAKVATTNATATAKPGATPALVVATGHPASWAGVALPPSDGHWDLSRFGQILLQVKNAGGGLVTVHCRADNPGADGKKHCVAGTITLGPGRTDTLKVWLRRANDDTLGGKLFGMVGYPVSTDVEGTIDPRNVTQLLLFVEEPKEEHVFEIAGIRAAGAYVPPTAWTTDADPFFPFIDTFGQYRHKDWPGKTRSLAELGARREQEAKDLAGHPGPKDWDKYGGSLSGPQLRATGFFRTEKVAGKWWLVDPEGHLFFSHGIDCVRMQESTAIEERESWFADFPGRQPEFAPFLSHGRALMSHYGGRSPEIFSFDCANLLRKYGPDWHELASQLAHRRLRSWGLNTIANWSDEATFLMRLTPYTDSIVSGPATKAIEGSEGYWSKFPDVFDPSFADALRRSMEGKRGKSAGDAWCIGYFSDNEMSWGDDVSLAAATLKSPPDQAAKKLFIADLQAKYSEIAKLNQAWGTAHASWQALLESRDAPDAQKAQADLTAFYSKIAEQYFRTARDTIKAIAPNQLYLGCRFAWVNRRAAAAAAKYCDVVSYNLYRRSVADFPLIGGADVPLIIGEFHFGALDRGMFHPGLVPVADQAARAQAYKDYVLGALRHPQFVGCHWFQYQDEPTTGRVYDGENYQIGFVDVCDTPYPETIEACRAVGAMLYQR
jgi:hypothetical protein